MSAARGAPRRASRPRTGGHPHHLRREGPHRSGRHIARCLEKLPREADQEPALLSSSSCKPGSLPHDRAVKGKSPTANGFREKAGDAGGSLRVTCLCVRKDAVQSRERRVGSRRLAGSLRLRPRRRQPLGRQAQERAAMSCAFLLFDIPVSPRARASRRNWATLHVSSGTVTVARVFSAATGRPAALASVGAAAWTDVAVVPARGAEPCALV